MEGDMKISGHLDLCGSDLIEGWLYCDSWEDGLTLQIFVADRLIGECVANAFRQDLQEAGYGDGHCGFSFKIPPEVQIQDVEETRLRLVGTPVYLLPDNFTVFKSKSGEIGTD
jgi:hypothetical protein